MSECTSDRRHRHAQAWIGQALALGVHVFDEAWNDFLSVYNPTVRELRERLGFFPMPTFTFEVWLSGLILLVAVLMGLTPFVYRGARWTRWLSYFLGVLMLLNGVGHIVGSMYMGRMMPGVYSSPLLLAASMWLFHTTRRAAPVHPGPPGTS